MVGSFLKARSDCKIKFKIKCVVICNGNDNVQNLRQHIVASEC